MMLRLPARYGTRNPFAFMDLQHVQELANFFERRVSAYQVGVQPEVPFEWRFSHEPTLRFGRRRA
jgi:ribonucleoside-diphosphate reductase beta chain